MKTFKTNKKQTHFAARFLIDALGRLIAFLSHGEPFASIGTNWTLNGEPGIVMPCDLSLTEIEKEHGITSADHFKQVFPDIVFPLICTTKQLNQLLHSNGVDVWIPFDSDVADYFKEYQKPEKKEFITVPMHPRENKVLCTLFVAKDLSVSIWLGNVKLADEKGQVYGNGRCYDHVFSYLSSFEFDPVGDDSWLDDPIHSTFANVWIDVEIVEIVNEGWEGKRVFEIGMGLGDNYFADIYHPEFGERTIDVGFCYDIHEAIEFAESKKSTFANQFNYIDDNKDDWSVVRLYIEG